MTKKEYHDYQAAAALGLIPDSDNPLFLFSGISKDLLLDIVNGKLDPIQLARIELRNRGLDLKTGRWIGWKQEADKDLIFA